jgi:deoxyribonucleoside regulator
MKEEDEMLAVKAAELYFEENKTQEEIAQILILTRWKVGRLLTQARAEGIVRIEIVHPRARRLSVERELLKRFELFDAVVVPSSESDSGTEIRQRVASAAAEYLTVVRPSVKVLGISWGRTLHEIAQALPTGWGRNVSVVQINGGVSVNKRSSNAAATAVTIATKSSGTATLLPSPAILDDEAVKEAIASDRTVAAVLAQAKSADTYIYSAGVVETTSVLVDSGYLSPVDIDQLVKKGAVADVIGRFIDADGNIIDPGLDRRTVGIDIEDLRRAKRGIAVIAGPAKNDACRAVVNSGLCSVIITDEITARHLLGESHA